MYEFSSIINKSNKKAPSPILEPNKKEVFFQPKLTINQPNDIYEQEADAMADKVMRMPDTAINEHLFFKPDRRSIQLKCAHCKEEESQAQRKEINSNFITASSETESYIHSLSGGRALQEKERSFFEPRMGYDFSDVKIHTDADAASSAKSINALAYTTGNNIVFNDGEYSPDTNDGKKLLGHELTHVMQQGSQVARHIQRAPIIEPGKSKSSAGAFDPLIGIYTVAAGDNLTSIAARFSTSVATIVKNNPDIKDPNNISIGQKIFLPDLIVPHDPAGMKHSEISFDDYVKKWEAEKGRPITAPEKSELERGCVGISSINTGGDPLSNLQNCFDNFENGLKFARNKNESIKKAHEEKKKKVQMFSMRFWSGGKAYAPAATGKVDMTDYSSRLASGDAWKPDDALGSDYINFDFGYYDVETGMWWHANHAHEPFPGGMGEMKAFVSSLDYYSKPILDFDKQIFCVVVKNI